MTAGLRRWALLLVASALAAGPVAVVAGIGPARAAGPCGTAPAPCVVVTPHDASGTAGPVQYVSESEIDTWADTHPFPGYRYRNAYALEKHTAADNLPTTGTVPYGLTLSNLISHLAPEPPASLVQVMRANGTLVSLSADDLTDRAAFLDGLPTFYDDGDGDLGFVRPLRAHDARDVNVLDNLTDYGAGVIDVDVYAVGSVLHPTITVSDAMVHLKQSATFTTATPDAAPGAALSYRWDFGDGTTTTTSGPTESHVYTAKGEYLAQVTVTDAADNASGQSDGVFERVGKAVPPTKGKPKPGGGTGTKSNPPTGPDHGTGTGGPPAGTSTTPSSAHAASTPPSTSPGSASPTTGRTAATTAAGNSAAAPPTRSRSSDAARPDRAGTLVHGFVIDAAQQAVPPSSAASSPREQRSVAPQASRRASVAPVNAMLLWWLLLPALLVVGVLRERRRPTRRPARAGKR